MASITKRPGGKYRARYRDPAGREHARHFTRKIDAQRWLDEVTASTVRGEYVDPKLGRVTVGDWSARWLASKANVKPSTRDRYAGIVASHIDPAWGDARLIDVMHADVQSWVSTLTAAGQSAGSVHKIHRVLSMVLGLAVKDGRLPRNPAAGVNLPRAVKADKRYLRPEHVADFAQAAGPGRLVVLVLAYTGLRWANSRRFGSPGSTCSGDAFTLPNR